MCMQCVGIVGTAFQAATLVGGPVVVKNYQRIRAAFGLPDNSVAAVEARALAASGQAALAPGIAAEPAAASRRTAAWPPAPMRAGVAPKGA